VKKILSTAAEHLAPRTVQNLRRLSALDPELDRALPLLLSYERELRTLQREVDELRRDHRRVAELYDAVFEWMHSNAAARGATPDADGATTVDRVAKELAEGE
jgi:type II secretory pathway component PulK